MEYAYAKPAGAVQIVTTTKHIMTNVIQLVNFAVGPQNTNASTASSMHPAAPMECVNVMTAGAEQTVANGLVSATINVFTDVMVQIQQIACFALTTLIKILSLDVSAWTAGVEKTVPYIPGTVPCDVLSAKVITTPTAPNVCLTQLCTQTDCAIATCSTKAIFVISMST